MSIIDSLTSKLGSFIGLNTTQPTRKVAGFDINEFKSAISSKGVLPNNLFLVTIYPKSFDISYQMTYEQLNPQLLSFFCMQTDLPGVDLGIEENIVLGTGPVERFPHTALFGDINLNFIGDAKGNIITFFHNWLNSIVNFDGSKNYSNFYRVAYKDTYTCTIEILVFNQASDQILKYQLYDAFPYRVNQIQMSWAEQNSMMNIGTSFYYKTWHSERMIPQPDAAVGGLTTVQKLLKLGTVAETVLALKKPQSVGDAINLVNNANIVGGGLSGFF